MATSDEQPFLDAIRADRTDAVARHVYADWLEEQGDPRGEFLRLQTALRMLPPDHSYRPGGEAELSRLRKGLDPLWLVSIEPERGYLFVDSVAPQTPCRCFDPAYSEEGFEKSEVEADSWREVYLHAEPQDTECDGWKKLLDLIDEAAATETEEFAPLREMSTEERAQIVTLPPTIGKLKSLRKLMLYGSNLIRIPPEIGQMTNLEEFTPYTSYRLHWFPYEITRCTKLRDSTVSTRALYGNFKFRPPFPELRPYTNDDDTADRTTCWELWSDPPFRHCSVCEREFEDLGKYRVWITLPVATDALPLLVNACSEDCVLALPKPAKNHVTTWHRGGLSVPQPPPRW